MRAISLLTAAALAVAGCGGGESAGGSDNSAADANHIAEDPYGATGAPGADLTDNGVTDGANGLADTNFTREPNLMNEAASPPANHQ